MDGERRAEQTSAHPPPTLAYIEAYLGQPTRDRSLCWLCKVARTDSTAIAMKRYNEMVTMFIRSRIDTDPVVLAMEMAKFFEFHIRRPANKFRQPRQQEVPELRAVDIYWHFKVHMKESSNRLLQRLEELQEIGDTIYQNCLFKPVKDVRERWILVPRKKYIDPYVNNSTSS